MSLNPRSSMRALDIPEIIMNITQCMQTQDLPAASLVCREWTDWASERIWKEARVNFHHLLEVVGLVSLPVSMVSCLIELEAGERHVAPNPARRDFSLTGVHT